MVGSTWLSKIFSFGGREGVPEIFSGASVAENQETKNPIFNRLHLLSRLIITLNCSLLYCDQRMESSAVLSLPQVSFYPPNSTRSKGYTCWPRKKPRTAQATRLRCQKMYVPGFGEASPEAKAANNLHHFFTYIAVRIVTAQLESYNPEAHEELMEFLGKHSLDDGDKFCANLMRESSRHKSLALRILEVRSAYCKNDFEWDNLKRLANKMVGDSNTRLMRDYVLETSHDDIESEK